MIIIQVSQLKQDCDTVRQFGNHLFTRNADLVSVYEIIAYNGVEPETAKDLGVTYTITDNTTWTDLTDRFFGRPQMPDFTKVLKV